MVVIVVVVIMLCIFEIELADLAVFDAQLPIASVVEGSVAADNIAAVYMHRAEVEVKPLDVTVANSVVVGLVDDIAVDIVDVLGVGSSHVVIFWGLCC